MASNNNDNKNKAISALITLLIGAGIVALLFFTGLRYNYPPLEEMLEAQLLQDTIMFGGEYVDLGDFMEEQLDDQPAEVAEPAQQQETETQNVEPQKVGQNDLKDVGAREESPQPVVSTKTQESPMKVQEQQPKKQPAETKTVQPKQPEKPQKQGEPKQQATPKKTENPNTASTTSATSSEADSKMKKAFGKTSGSGTGKQGNPDGTPGGEKKTGKPGVGGGLAGYTISYFPTAPCPGPGTVIVRVTVSPTGTVTRATVIGGSVANPRARSICENLARQSRFSVPTGQTIERTGTLIYNIP